jgi:AmiR/NasT family two-component response regulator
MAVTRRTRQPAPAAERFLQLARQSRKDELQRLSLLVALAGSISALVHGLQRERGTSSIFLASGGARFATDRAERATEVLQLAAHLHEQLVRLTDKPDAGGSRFYLRAARALQQLTALEALRAQIATQALTPEESLRAFSAVIGDLLALSFEAADGASDPVTARSIVALASFSQGKELAGQERATAGAAFSRGRVEEECRARLRHLATGEERALGVFREFAAPELVKGLDTLVAGNDWQEVVRIRVASQSEGAAAIAADAWYEAATRRIDALKGIEDAIIAELGQLCERALSESLDPLEEQTVTERYSVATGMPLALLITDADPEANGLDLEGGIGFYAFEGALPRPMRSILDVLDAQSRRINDVSGQLDAARSALAERKLIERAKGLLMKGHELSESRAYTLMREMAMGQNKRMVEVAQAIIAMATRLPSA